MKIIFFGNMKKHYLVDLKVWHRNKLLNMPEKDQSMDDYIYFEKIMMKPLILYQLKIMSLQKNNTRMNFLMNIKKEIMIYRELN